jgi:TIR domain
MADIFISYASADREKARVVAETFATLGFSVWWDRTIPPGEVFDEVLQRALDDAKCVVVLWSANSVSSNWVKTEAAEASARNVLVPALIEEARVPIEFKRIQCANLTGWDSNPASPEFASLLASVRRLVAKPAAANAGAVADHSVPVRPAPHATPRAGPRVALLALALGALAVAAATAFMLMRPAGDELPDAKQAKAPIPVVAAPANNARADVQPPAAVPGSNPQPTPDRPAPATVMPPKASAKPADKAIGAATPIQPQPIPAKPMRINLLASENGGQLVVAGDPVWMKSITHYEDQQGWAAFGEAVYAFKDQRAATFDTFSVLILRAHDANLKDFVLLAGSDSPTGRFEPIGQFTVQNVRMMNSPYQDFTFAPVKAKYLKVRLINTHGGRTGGAVLHKFKLMGSVE